MVSPLERIATSSIIVKTSGSGDKERNLALIFVVVALDEISPPSELVDLIEDQDWLLRWKMAIEYALSVAQ